MRSRRAYVEVVVPPAILDTKGSADLVVREAAQLLQLIGGRFFFSQKNEVFSRHGKFFYSSV
jgi:hypothetical protein